MAIPTTIDANNFLEWRNNTNTVANSVGDMVSLDLSPLGIAPQSNLVSAANEIAVASAASSEEMALIFSIALG